MGGAGKDARQTAFVGADPPPPPQAAMRRTTAMAAIGNINLIETAPPPVVCHRGGNNPAIITGSIPTTVLPGPVARGLNIVRLVISNNPKAYDPVADHEDQNQKTGKGKRTLFGEPSQPEW